MTTSYRVGYWLMLLKRRSLIRYHPNVSRLQASTGMTSFKVGRKSTFCVLT